jgi:CRP/FNR family transcriptional regulator, cyclic AMP receptor protein
VKQRQESDSEEQIGVNSRDAKTTQSLVERRRSMPSACSECVSKQACALSRSPWFQSIKTVSIYSRHVTLVRQGDKCKNIYVLRRGWLQITHVMPNGKSIVDLWCPGSIVGVAPAVIGETYLYSAMTLEDSEVELADASEFLKHLKKDSHITFDLLRYFSRQITQLLSHFYDAAAKIPMEDRLLRVLAEISSTCGVQAEGGVRINLPLPIQVLADWIGCSRQWASKLLSNLEARGDIKRRNGWITLTRASDSHRPPISRFQ